MLSPASEGSQGEPFASGLLNALIALPQAEIQLNDLDALLKSILETVLHYTGFECGALYLYLGEDAGINLGALHVEVEPVPESDNAASCILPTPPQQVIHSRQPIYSNEMQDDPVSMGEGQSASYVTRLSLPLFNKNIPQGVLDLFSHQYLPLSSQQIGNLDPAMEAIAQMIASALRIVRFQITEDWLNRNHDFSNRILAAGTYHQALDLMLRYIIETSHAYSASAFLYSDQSLTQALALDSQLRQIEDEPMPRPQGTAHQIMRTGKPVIVSGFDPRPLKDLQPHLIEQGIQAYAGLPLRDGADAPFGVFFVRYKTPHLFLPDEIEALNLFSVQAAGAIEHMRLLEESRRRETELANMVDTVHLLITTLDVDELLNQITVRIAWMTGMDSCAISIYNKEQQNLRMLAQYSKLGDMIEEDLDTLFYLDDYPLTRHVLETNQPCLVRADDPDGDTAEIFLLKKMNYQAVLLLPLAAAGEPYGLVELYSVKADVGLSGSDFKRLSALSEQVTLALINARHYQEEQRARLTAETLRQATAALNSSLDLHQVLDLILDQICRMIDYEYASLMLLEGKYLQIAAVRGRPFTDEMAQSKIPLEESGLPEALVKSKDWIILSDAQTDSRFNPTGFAESSRSWLGLPLVSRDKVIGVLTVESRKPGLYSRADAAIVMTFADQAALAVENARLFESERDNRTMAEALGEISLALSSSLKASATLEILFDQIKRVVPYDTAAVLLLEGSQVRMTSQRGYERFGQADILEKFSLSLEQVPNLQYMAYTLCSKFITDVDNFSGWVKTDWGMHIKSWVGAPLVAREHLLGFLSLDKTEPGYYTQEYASRLEVLARHAALALLNALNFGEVEQASITDYLTGAFNHRYFQQQLRVEWERAARTYHPLSLLIMDIDHFKQVNDAYGHLTGDQVLKMITNRLKAELRASDQLARYGGEEFAVILPNTSTQGAEIIGERLKRSVSAFPFWVENLTIDITISIGVATYPDLAGAPQDLISMADKAMYAAKENGRNCIQVARLQKTPH